MADEKETKGVRTILNFGHTVGHAIEAASGFDLYHHGEAIALGMRIASEMSLQLKMVSQNDVAKINVLLSLVGLPEEIKRLKISAILRMMQHDKKFVRGKNRFVLVKSIGRVEVKKDIPLPIVTSAIKTFLK